MTRFFTALALFLTLFSMRAIAGPYDTFANREWLNVTRPVTAADMKDRAVLLDFWTYGCINCMQVVPDLTALEQQFGDKLLIIGIHSAKFEGEQGSERILAAAKRFGLKHPVINDSNFDIWNSFGIRAWPTLVVLGPNGQEVARFEGEGHKDEIAKAVAGTASATKAASLAGLVDNQKAGGIIAFPARIVVDGDTIYVADTGHNRIAAFDVSSGQKIWSVSGFNAPRGITLSGNILYIADTGSHTLKAIDVHASEKAAITVAGNDTQGRSRMLSKAPALKISLASPWDVEPLADGRIAIANAGTHQILAFNPETKTVSTLAGSGAENITDGPADEAALAQTSGLSVDGDTLYFVDAESSALRTLKNGTINTLIGTGLFDFGLKDGKYPEAMLQHPQGIFAANGKVFVADTYNNAIRIYSLTKGTLTTLPLKGGKLKEPGDVTLIGSKLYVADTNSHAIKTVDIETGKVSAITLHE